MLVGVSVLLCKSVVVAIFYLFQAGAAPNGAKISFLEYHKQPACDFGAVILPRENRKIPQAGGLRYTKEIINLVPLGGYPNGTTSFFIFTSRFF